jgi:hypothetical protein
MWEGPLCPDLLSVGRDAVEPSANTEKARLDGVSPYRQNKDRDAKVPPTFRDYFCRSAFQPNALVLLVERDHELAQRLQPDVAGIAERGINNYRIGKLVAADLDHVL